MCEYQNRWVMTQYYTKATLLLYVSAPGSFGFKILLGFDWDWALWVRRVRVWAQGLTKMNRTSSSFIIYNSEVQT